MALKIFVDTGTADHYIISANVVSLKVGAIYSFLPEHSNTGPSNMSFEGYLSIIVPIKKLSLQNLSAGDIVAKKVATVTYNGSYMIMDIQGTGDGDDGSGGGGGGGGGEIPSTSLTYSTSFLIGDWILDGVVYYIVFDHDLNSKNIVCEIWDETTSSEVAIVQKIYQIDTNNVRIEVPYSPDYRFNGRIVIKG